MRVGDHDEDVAQRANYATDENISKRQSLMDYMLPADTPQPALWDEFTWRDESVVIDVGCGNGLWSSIASDRNAGGLTLGLDLSAGMLDALAAAAPSVVPVQADAERLPFKARTADAVLALWMMYHLRDEQTMLREAVRVLKVSSVVEAVNGWATGVHLWGRSLARRAGADPRPRAGGPAALFDYLADEVLVDEPEPVGSAPRRTVMTSRLADLRKSLVAGGLAGALVAVSLVAGCGAASTRGASEAHTDSIIPSRSFSDWLGFARQVSVVSVLSDRKLPQTPAEKEEGFPARGRELTVDIEDTVWAHPAQEAVAGELALRGTHGWYEVGQRYLVALIHHDGWGWAPLSDETSSFLLDGAGRVTANPGASVNDALVGKTAPEVRDLLAGEAPDPVAAKYAHLDPVSRAEAYLDEKHP